MKLNHVEMAVDRQDRIIGCMHLKETALATLTTAAPALTFGPFTEDRLAVVTAVDWCYAQLDADPKFLVAPGTIWMGVLAGSQLKITRRNGDAEVSISDAY